jgi:hypothetical protein
MRRRIIRSFLIFACIGVSSASAQELARNISWSSLKESGKLTIGEILPGGPGIPPVQLKIENSSNQPKTVTLWDSDTPAITKYRYALEGKIRYENVQGKSYLEMWSYFQDGNMYFSRTLGDSGPIQSLEGSSDWRPITLPFYGSEKSGPPTRIVVNLVFAGTGTVYLTNMKLLQYEGDRFEELIGQQTGWWSDQGAGWIGGIGGVVFGTIGAFIGILAGMGKARRFVLVVTVIMFVLGILGLILGIVALTLGQPYAVCFPLILMGVILSTVCGANFPGIRRRYEQMELRKMAAMDAGLVNS